MESMVILLNGYLFKRLNSFRSTTRFFPLRWASLQDQYQNFTVRLMHSKSPFQRWCQVCFHSNIVFLTIYNSLLYSLHTRNIGMRSVEKYKNYGTLSKTTHFLSVFCEAGVVQQCTEAQAGVVQDGFIFDVKEGWGHSCSWIRLVICYRFERCWYLDKWYWW